MSDHEEIKKRKYPVEEGGKVNNNNNDDGGDGIDKKDAIRNAIEAAKKIKAKLDNKIGKDDVEDKEDKDTTLIKDDITFPYTKSFDISKSKHISLLTSASFPSLLRSRLQLGPQELFTAQITSANCLILSASSEDILLLAEKELLSVQETGQFRSLKPTSKLITEKILLNFDPLPTHISFLRGKLLGPQGSFLKHIQSATGTRVQLRGKGSGYFEVNEPRDGTAEGKETMYLWVEGTEVGKVEEANIFVKI